MINRRTALPLLAAGLASACADLQMPTFGLPNSNASAGPGAGSGSSSSSNSNSSSGNGSTAPSSTTSARQVPADVRYACCNLRYDGDWISDANQVTLPFIPAGTPVEFQSYGRHRAHVRINGKPMRIGHDYGREQESLEAYTDKLLVTQDPKRRLATWPAAVQQAVRSGRVSIGMTKEQVLMSLGYPRTDQNPLLDVSAWLYWSADNYEVSVLWSSKGTVRDVEAERHVRRRLLTDADDEPAQRR